MRGPIESLEILSLARNQLKKIENLDSVAGTLKQLWISYNNIVALNGIEKLQNLEVLYMSNNKVHDIKEIERLQSLPKLTELLFHGNAFHSRFLSEGGDEKEYRFEIMKRCGAGGRQRAHGNCAARVSPFIAELSVLPRCMRVTPTHGHAAPPREPCLRARSQASQLEDLGRCAHRG